MDQGSEADSGDIPSTAVTRASWGKGHSLTHRCVTSAVPPEGQSASSPIDFTKKRACFRSLGLKQAACFRTCLSSGSTLSLPGCFTEHSQLTLAI